MKIKAVLKNGNIKVFADTDEAAKYFKHYYSAARKVDTVKYNIDSALRGHELRYDKSDVRHTAYGATFSRIH